MEKQLISLLNKQIKKLDADDFDLEAWKGSTIALLTKIFGAQDARIIQITKLNIDYSSWALRDSKSTYNPMGSCKKQGKEILEMSVDEISTFGAPGHTVNEAADAVVKILENELKVSQFKSLKSTLAKAKSTDDLIKEIENWDQPLSSKVIAQIIQDMELKDKL